MEMESYNSPVVTLFTQGHGTFSRMLQFEVLVVIFFVAFILTSSFPKTYGFVILLLACAWYIANSYVTVKTEEMSDFNERTMNKLNVIQSKINAIIAEKIRRFGNHSRRQLLSSEEIAKVYQRNIMESLYMDSNLINFIYSIVDISQFNGDLFYTFVKGVNGILRIRREIEEYHEANGTYPQNTSEMMESALTLKMNTLNNLHDFIYKVPKSNMMYRYIGAITQRYNILITRNIVKIHKSYTEHIGDVGINNSTKFITLEQTRPYEQVDTIRFYG